MIFVSFGILNYLNNFSTKFLSSVWYFCCIDFQIISLMLLLIVFYRSIKILIGHGKRAKFMIAYLVHENIFAIQNKKNICSRCKYEKSCSSFSPFKDILSNISASYAFGNALRKIPHMACRHQIYLMHLSFDNLALHHV